LNAGADEHFSRQTKCFSSKIVVTTANIGAISGRDMILDHVEVRLALSAAVIVPATSKLALVGEFDYQNEIDYQIFAAGLDYKVGQGNRLRASIGSNFGIGNGAPEMALSVSLLRTIATPVASHDSRSH